MTHAAPPSPPYVITARSEAGDLRRTRVRAASAMVLARSWTEAGHGDVRVVDGQGRPVDPDRYRRLAMASRQFYR